MINEALRLFRVFHDKKTKELAEELEISTSYLSEIENGKKQPTLALIDKYADVFETSKSAILFFSEELDKTDNKTVRKNVRSLIFKFLESLEKYTNNAAKTKKVSR